MSKIMHWISVTFYVRWDMTVLYNKHPFIDSLLSTYSQKYSIHNYTHSLIL